MNDKSNDSLEEFFRKRTENHHFEFQESDWAKLKRRLDDSDEAAVYRKSNLKRGFIIGAALLVAAAALYFILDLGNGKKTRDGQQERRAISSQMDNEIPALGSPADPVREKEAIQNAQEQAFPQVKSRRSEKQNSDELSQSLGSAGGSDPGAERHSSDSNRDPGLHKTQADNRALTTVIMGNTPNSQVHSSAGSKSISDNHYTFANNTIPFMFPVWHINTLGMPQKTLKVNAFPARISKAHSESSDLIPLEKAVAHRPFLSVGFTVAPDFSSVGIFHYTPPGKRVGVSLGYSLSKKFELRTGFILTDNKYSAEGNQYTPPNGYWPNGDVPYKATGKCKILDIPVDIRYNVGLWDRHQVFITAGISSYLMLEEHYWFSYPYDDPNAMKYWGGKNTSQEILALMNISAGYEFTPKPWLGLSIEPFIKIPISGIGYGNVSLYTIGGYFTIRYKMFRNSKKTRGMK